MDLRNILGGIILMVLALLGYLLLKRFPLEHNHRNLNDEDSKWDKIDRFDSRITSWRFNLAVWSAFLFGLYLLLKEFTK